MILVGSAILLVIVMVVIAFCVIPTDADYDDVDESSDTHEERF